jgi:hypothetical protein
MLFVPNPLLSVLAAALLLFGCIQSSNVFADNILNQKETPLTPTPYAWSPNGKKLWPMPAIRVCFSAHGDWTTSDAAFKRRSAAIRSTLEVALASLGGSGTALTVYGWEDCPEPGTQSLLNTWRISLQYFSDGRPDGRASADIGYDPSRETGVAFGGEYPQMGIVHEFGHALGFQHEFWRHDITVGCTERLGHTNEDSNEGKHSPQEGVFLTAYDPDSINNQTYCGLLKWDGVYTELDKAAIAFMYPKQEPPIYITNQIAFDGGIVVPENSMLYATSYWVHRGILKSAAMIDGCDLGLGGANQLSLLKSNKTVNITCHFKDFWGRKRFSDPIKLVKSDSKFASIISAVLF